MHVDVNNAFLSWQALYLLKHGHNYDIRYTESVIGGDEKSRHGIVLAKSMVAKSRGVKTAETLKEARKKCKKLEVYPPNFRFYKFMSNKMFELISKYTSDIEILSIDECFIDYGKVKNMYGDEIAFAYKLKKEIKNTLGFTVNIGVANNKLCAKMASDFIKPDRVHTLYDYEIKNKMYPLDVGDLYGIGKKTTIKLKNLKINTIGDLANANLEVLSKYFKNQAKRMIESAKGIDDSAIITKKREALSISKASTFGYNLKSLDEIYKALLPLTEQVCFLLRKKGKYAKVICIQLKDKYFNSYSHQKQVINATNNTDYVYRIAKNIVKEMYNDEEIRLVGISLNKISSSNNYQISMFENIEDIEKKQKLDKTLDSLKKEYGDNIIIKAVLNVD